MEERGNERLLAKMKMSITSLKQSQPFQSVAIKFWILIVNLQYYDVKKLTQNYLDRQVDRGYERAMFPEAQIEHTNLPVDLVIYERVVPLFMKSLGSIGDPNFTPLAIPASVEQQNLLMKKKQKELLLYGRVHYEKFVTDLALMLGRNLLNLSASDVTYIYRKSLLAMTQRFSDDLHFI